ncbi:MAG: hypothetical protein HYU51_19715 [Candidatus Rokubacteria bacterium]|nr:hypothetical protein [Candidatus Rokubacteria bacterium]
MLAKESFENEGGKPGARGPPFIMEKRKKGYDNGRARDESLRGQEPVRAEEVRASR